LASESLGLSTAASLTADVSESASEVLDMLSVGRREREQRAENGQRDGQGVQTREDVCAGCCVCVQRRASGWASKGGPDCNCVRSPLDGWKKPGGPSAPGLRMWFPRSPGMHLHVGRLGKSLDSSN
jgi:hypothetical protein